MGAAAAAFLILRYPQLSADGAREGLNLCALIVIPALFPFMALCAFISQSGLSARLGKLLSPVTRVLFHLEGNAGAAILMSWIGGYPVGARSADALYQQGQISLSDAQRMLPDGRSCFVIWVRACFWV